MLRVAVVLCVLCTIARAEVKTTESVTLRARAGEKAPAVTTLPAGTVVEVVRTEGRWVVVRVGIAQGYVTRTQLDLPPPSDAPAPAPTPGGWHGGADDARDRTILARTNDPTAVATAPRATTEPTIVRRAVRPLAIELDVGVGFRALGREVTSNANGVLGNYLVDAGAMIARARVATIVHRGALVLGGDAAVAGGDASPGIDYQGPSAVPGKIPFRTFTVDAGARIGVRVKDAVELAARVGGRYDAFLPTSTANAGMLPRERLLGLVGGVRVDAAPPRSPITAALRVDVLAYGARAQTPGLEDGSASTSRAVWGGVTLRLPLGARWSVLGDLELAREWTHWTGASVREPGATRTDRVETSQVVQLGVGASL